MPRLVGWLIVSSLAVFVAEGGARSAPAPFPRLRKADTTRFHEVSKRLSTFGFCLIEIRQEAADGRWVLEVARSTCPDEGTYTTRAMTASDLHDPETLARYLEWAVLERDAGRLLSK
jgi:hypothetical protein